MTKTKPGRSNGGEGESRWSGPTGEGPTFWKRRPWAKRISSIWLNWKATERSIKNLTTELAEHTEIKTGKGSRPSMHAEKWTKPPMGFHKMISAPSASSSFSHWSSCTEDAEKEWFWFSQRRKNDSDSPKGEKNRKSQRFGRTQRIKKRIME